VKEIELYLLQLDPGTETTFCNNCLAPNRTDHWKVMGKYDVMCLASRDERGQGNHDFDLQCARPYVQDFIQIRLFGLGPHSSSLGDITAWLTKAKEENWIALSLLKISPGLLMEAESANQIQLDLAESVRRLFDSHHVECSLMGGYGWHELAVLLAGDRIRELGDLVLLLGGLSKAERPAFLKMYTVFGLNYDLVRNTARLAELRETTDRVRMVTHIVTKANASHHLCRQAKEIFGPGFDVGMSFGADDVFIAGQSDALVGDYIRKLLQLREGTHAEGGLLATSTSLELSGPEELQHRHCSSPSLIDEKVEALLSSQTLDMHFDDPYSFVDSTDIEWHAQRLSIVLNSCLRNRLSRDAYIDMLPTLVWLNRKPFRSSTSGKVILDYVGAGYQQRFLGTLDTVWTSGNPVPLFYRAGIQRVLWAVEYLCHSLLKRRGFSWRGFVVFGLAREYLRTHSGIINLPYRAMFHPSEWWGVFHEIGHEYVYLIRERHQEEWENLIRGAFSIPTSHAWGRNEEMRYAMELTWEVMADIFDFRYGFHGNWELYCDVVFDHVVRLSLGRLAQGTEVDGSGKSVGSVSLLRVWDRLGYFLSRLASTYWYSKGVKSTDFPYEEFLIDVRPRLEATLRQCETNVPQIASVAREIMKKVQMDDVRTLLHVYHRIEDLLASQEGSQLLSLVFSEPGDNIEDTHDMESVLDSVRRGVPVDCVPSPEVLIYELARHKRRCEASSDGADISNRMATAAILSLWSCYAQELPGIVDDLDCTCKK